MDADEVVALQMEHSHLSGISGLTEMLPAGRMLRTGPSWLVSHSSGWY